MVYFLLFVFLVLLLYRCYYYIGITDYTALMGYGALLLYSYMFINGFKVLSDKLYRIEIGIVVSTFISFILSVMYFNNSITVFSRYLIPLSFLPYFYLVQKRVNFTTIEYILAVTAIVYMFCWFYQVWQVPLVVFGDDRGIEINNSRGFVRLWIATKEHFSYLLFFSLALYNRTKKIVFIVIALMIFAIVILHVGRQMILWSGLLAFFYYIYTNSKNVWRLGILAILVFLAANYFLENFTVVADLIDTTESSQGGINSFDTNNIRIKAIGYFIENYNTNPFTILFGSGFVSEGSEIYRKLLCYENLGYYLDDVGFVAMYCNTGLISVILYFVLFYKILFKYKVASRYLYLKFYIAYILLLYMGSHALTSNLIFVVLALYILKANSIQIELKSQKNMIG